MPRLVTALSVLSGLVLVFVAVLARADVATRYHTLVGAAVFAVVAVAVVIAALFTFLYMTVLRGVGWGWISGRFSAFVGFMLLRSHRVTPTMGTRLRESWARIVTTTPATAVVLALTGAALLLGALVLEGIQVHNAVADASSPAFVRTLQGCGVMVGCVALAQAAAWLVGRRAPYEVPRWLRIRTAVNLPTFISIVGVSIGVWALVLVLSVMQGFESDLRDKILRTNAHIVVEPADAADVLGDAFALTDAIEAMPGVAEAIPFAYGEVMMASSTNIAVNVVVKGMEPRALAGSEQLAGRVSPGDVAWLDTPYKLTGDRFRYPIGAQLGEAPAGSVAPSAFASGVAPVAELLPGVLLGVELASSLQVDVGSEIQVISPDGDVGPTGLRPKLRSFRVAGLFATGMYEYDQKLAYMAVDDAQRFLNLAGDLNRLEVRVAAAEDTDPVMAAISAWVAEHAPSLEVADWRQRNRSLFSALQLERIVMFIVLGFIILVASLLIVSSLVMVVVEKARDIAVLKALGAANRSIVRTFLMIGAVIGAVGSAAGLTIGGGFVLVMATYGVPLPAEYYINSVPVDFDPIEVGVVAFAAFLICLAATAYPARAAASLSPVEGLRHG